MALPQRRDDRHYTYADYLTWDDDLRWELIDGRAFAMAPAPSLRHQDYAGRIYAQALSALRGRPCRVFIAPVDVRLPKPGQSVEKTDTVVQPDVLAVCDPAKLDEKGVTGAPDWVVEVLSPMTASHDNILKRRVYEEAGVREYWLVHPDDRLVFIYRLIDGAYGKPEIQDLTGTTPIAALPDVIIDWDAIVGAFPEAASP
ncbi:MAG: Uma2 family endonuclease [Pseudomonadota bacterium]